MEELLNGEVKEFVKKKFEAELVDRVTIVFFTQEPSSIIVPGGPSDRECLYCRETRKLLEEISALSDKIELKVYDIDSDRDKAASFGVDKIPATVVMNGQDHGIRFFGIPAGYEFTSLLEALVDVSRARSTLADSTREALAGLTNDVHIQVFVTPTCPYCPMAVRLAHQMALESPRVKADMIEASEFPHLTQKYEVYGVPKTIMNETVSVEGGVPEDVFLQHVLQAAGR